VLLGDVQVRLKWLRQARNEPEMKVANGPPNCGEPLPNCKQFWMPRRSALRCWAGTRPFSAATRHSSRSRFLDGELMKLSVEPLPYWKAAGRNGKHALRICNGRRRSSA